MHVPHNYLVLFTYLLLGLCPTFMIRVFGDFQEEGRVALE